MLRGGINKRLGLQIHAVDAVGHLHRFLFIQINECQRAGLQPDWCGDQCGRHEVLRSG
uniref:Uncharacterized protein n=1 Tax=uncultured marine virus TaxID=186617 RepID=A0A0F7L7D6_9VIRU|nr:hypothetical protein CENSYa_0508 [uncultured marine virus]